MFFFLFFNVFCEDQCGFKEHSSVTSSISSSFKPLRGAFSTFGFTTNSTFPGFEDMGDNFIDYLLDIASVAVLFIILFVIFLFYFCIGQCCCCCCRAKESKKPTIINSVFHIVMAVLLLISVIFFYLAATSIGSSLSEFKEVFPKLDNTLSTVIVTFNETVDAALVHVTTATNSAEDIFKNAQLTIEGKADEASTAANSLKTEIQTISSAGTDLDSYAQSFDNAYNEIAAKCNAEQVNLLEKVQQFSTRLSDISDSISQFDAEELKRIASDEISGNLDSITNQVNDQVDKFKNDLLPLVDPITDMRGDISEMGDPVDEILSTISKYFNPIVYTLCALLILYILGYTILYFFNNLIARCCMCSFMTVTSFWVFFFFIPAIVFSAIFYFFVDACPVFEDQFNSMLGDSLDGVNLKDALLCQTQIPLYQSLNLEEQLNYTQIVYDLKDEISGQISSINADEALKDLDTVLDVDVEGQFDEDALKGFNSQEILNQLQQLEDAANQAPGSECSNTVNSKIGDCKAAIQNIDNKLQALQSQITAAKGYAKETQTIASTISPLLNNSVTTAGSLVENLTDNVLLSVDAGINSLDCTLVCSVYSPIKNVLCVSLIDGMSYWLVSSIIFAVSVFCLSITICIRRRNMAEVKVEDKEKKPKDDIPVNVITPDDNGNGGDDPEIHYVTPKDQTNNPIFTTDHQEYGYPAAPDPASIQEQSPPIQTP